MVDPAVEHPIEPGLLLLLERYAKDLGKREVKPEEGLAPELPEFCQEFFQQFFESQVGLEITTIDAAAKRSAIRSRLRLGDDKSTLPVRRIILMFQDLCDLWPDISQDIYWTSESPLGQFHRNFMPRLLRRIVEWAESIGDEEITARASAAEQSFASAVTRI
jgi:hypothetical protein